MRRLPLLVVMLALAAPARAQETTEPAPPPPPPHEPFTQGTFTIDAMTTPGSHMGFGFYLTNRISIRPMLGVGTSYYGGTTFIAGADLRIETMPTNTWSFYGVATGSYRGGEDRSYGPQGSRNLYAQQDGALFGAGVGVRRRFHDRLMVVLDTRYLHAASASLSTTPLPSSFGQYRVNNQNQVVASLGLSFALN
jgi:hypothetical protein